MLNTKPFWQSKTLWLNVIGLVIVVLEYLGKINVVDPQIVASLLAVLNLILRVGVTQTTKLTLR